MTSPTPTHPPVLLFTDFGITGPYVGQLHSAIAQIHQDLKVIDLMHDLPNFSVEHSAILLEAAAPWFPEQCVICAVVDPGVGSARRAIAVRLGQRWYVGPDNGLLSLVAPKPEQAFELDLPASASASFHGRDLFAPTAARLAMGQDVGKPLSIRLNAPEINRKQVVYVDHYGNAMTGLKADRMNSSARLIAGGTELMRARTFSDVAVGHAFFYTNSWGLIEIAVNQGSAASQFGLTPGSPVSILED